MSAETITIRTMAPKGATQDQLLVQMQEIFRDRLGAELAVVNSPGRDGIDAALLALRDPPDGRHFLMTTAYALNYYPDYAEVGYRRADFQPVASAGAYNFVHVTAAANPWQTLGEALTALRAANQPLRFAGIGEVDLLMMRAIARGFGVPVAFKQSGGPALLAAVLAGEVDVGVGTGTHRPLLKQGKVRVLAQLHGRADTGPGAAPTPKDLGVDAVQENYAMLSIRAGADPEGQARSVELLLAALDDPRVAALVAERLLMAPGVMQGAALDAALATQRETFARLRALAG
jgi:tripartite-type tricarboxylate transporter receptor subunit TctC